MTETHPQFEHERYEELCALATAGALTPQEAEKLSAHLDECAECSMIFAQYETLATEGMPSLAGEYGPVHDAAFDETSALGRLMHTVDAEAPHPVLLAKPSAASSQWAGWRGAIAASLLVGVAFASYRIGEHTHDTASIINVDAPISSPASEQQVATEKQALNATISADNVRLAELEKDVAGSKAEADKLRDEAKDAQARLDTLNAALSASKSQSDAQLAALTQDRDATAAKLRTAQASYQSVQYELDTLRSQHKQDLMHLASMEDRVNGLNAVLNETDKRTKADEQYLASDRDIRDLIGARNLYIADIMDVDESGRSRKPFGRVFYTKTKSLIFYAYDLDKEQGIKQASTFQVWGRTGANDRKPINLGILYMDSESNKRWTLRVDNPQQLAQLDAVFVTAEPQPRNGVQPDKPSGKPFLYASLRRDANHP